MDVQEQRQMFQQLLEQHKGILYKIARTYCPEEEDKQDLIQEIMIQLWQSLPRYNDQFKTSTWLYRIALNVAISFYRKSRARKSKNIALPEQATLIMEADKPVREEQLVLLEQFIDDLKELDKALILLYLEEKTHAEISLILGISISNVATKIGRIKLQLKKQFSSLNT